MKILISARKIRNRLVLGTILSGILGSVVLSSRPAQASGITDSWSGASASVSYFGQTQANQGATATASTGGPETQHYAGSGGGTEGYSQQTTGSVQATAGGSPGSFLSVSATGSSGGDPGVIGSPANPAAIGDASAQWNNDAAIVTSKSGGSLPDAIRLNFTLTITSPAEINRAGLTASINGTTLTYSMMNYGNANSNINGPTSSFLDSSTTQTSPDGAGTRVDTFHIILPLNASGQSSPFNLGLNLSPDFNLYSGTTQYNMDGLGATLGLSSVTLPDGASLASMGDSVSFLSGLGSPNVVPEPATSLGWAVIIAIAGGSTAWRSRTGENARRG
jgi:hypothetical protein